MELYVTGERIAAGSPVVVSIIDGKAYAVNKGVAGHYLGTAIEELREGFRVVERNGEVREDDA
jgi:hypothetical protein